MVSLIALVPLLFGLFVCVGAALFALKRKSLAQSICIQQATRLQDDLKVPLKKLLAMNPHAALLRAKRQQADEQVRATAGTPAVVAATAYQAAVILEQIALRARQQALLAEATRIRAERVRDLRERAGRMDAQNVRAQAYYYRALAVEPKPAFDLTPDYETVPGFTFAQQQNFAYQVDVLAGFPRAFTFALPVLQKIGCAVSLTERSGDWEIRILEARAR